MTNFINNIAILDNIFGISRIVDATKKTIVNLDTENNINIDNHLCFEFWETGTECANCISMRALNEDKSFSKFETVNDKLYMIIASPININNNRYVVELVKDISDDTISLPFESSINNHLCEEIHRLNKLVVTDELTAIYNRRYINENLPYSISKVPNQITSLSIILIDVDRFKYINDTYGHIYGDYILKQISSIFNDYATKHNGWVARYGGDEFIMVLKDFSKELTYDLCKTLNNIINNREFIYNETNITVSCSFGFTTITDNNITLENLMVDLDTKLFTNKKCM